MTRIIDLTHTIAEGMPVYPGDPETRLLAHQTHENGGYLVSCVEMGTHSGTHLDAPLHRLPDGLAVDGIPLERLTGEAYILDLTELKPFEEITPEHLKRAEPYLEAIKILILKTGWYAHFRREDFYTGYNGISKEAALWLAQKKLNILALESPSVHATQHAEIHDILLQNNVLIVESLCNVDAIKKAVVQFYAVPLKLNGLDGSPVRAFAVE